MSYLILLCRNISLTSLSFKKINFSSGYPTDYQVAADIDNAEDCTINVNKVQNDVCQLRYGFE